VPVAEIGDGEQQAEIGQRQGQDGGFRSMRARFLPWSLNPFDGAATSAPTPITRFQPEPPMAAYQYIYVMKGLNKTFPGVKQVLKGHLAVVLPGAKMAWLGLNRRRQVDPAKAHGGPRRVISPARPGPAEGAKVANARAGAQASTQEGTF